MLFDKVSFPGLGIGPVDLNPDVFSIGSVAIKWYAVLIVSGILFAVLYIYFRSRRLGLLLDDLLDMALVIVFPAILCARLYYVIFYELEHPGYYDSLWKILDIRSGGLAIYGGIIGGALLTILIVRLKKVRLPVLMDLMAPGVMVAQAIGRWGNFVNVEAYGSETTLPWRMGVVEWGRWIYVHPTFLYESLWNLAGFALVMIFGKKKKYDGEIVLFYLAWYGFGRMFIEGLRTDSLYIGSTGIRVSQLVAALCFIFATAALIFFRIKIKGTKVADNIYYENAKHYELAEKEIAAYEEKQAAKKALREKRRAERKAARTSGSGTSGNSGNSGGKEV